MRPRASSTIRPLPPHPGGQSGRSAAWQPARACDARARDPRRDLAAGTADAESSIGFTYSDGFGREIQRKIQAEPGPLDAWRPDVGPRWVGSGWTIFNNKGKPVRQYEPFFSATQRFEFARHVGVSPILFYDPAGRVVATLHPDHSWEKIVFDAWRQETWDANDTVLIADPTADADVADFFHRLAVTDYLPGWHARRQGGALGPEAKAAAEKTAIHANTPMVSHFDSLGRTFLTVVHNKYKTSDMVLADPPIEAFHATRIVLDIEGNQREIIDAENRVVMRYDHFMAGPVKDPNKKKASRHIRQTGMDGGERWILYDVADKLIRAWDIRDHALRSTYDALRRPIESYVRKEAGSELLVGFTIYGESRPNPEADNLRGKLYQICDQAGTATTKTYDFKANPLESKRQLSVAYKTTLDWSGSVPLDPAVYTTRMRYDALNRRIELTLPDDSVLRARYNETNLLERIDVNLRAAAASTPLVTNIDYDAKGQRVLIAYDNAAVTEYTYDTETFRLAHLTTTRPGSAPDETVVQNLSYTYDPMGNITHVRDDAQQTIFFKNRRVEPSAEYTYDAVHQLIEGFGREHLGQTGTPSASSAPDAFDTSRIGLTHPGDGQAMGTYVERYQYDAVGNILAMRHHTSDPTTPDWTRSYAYNEASLIEPGKTNNRLSATTAGGTMAAYGHDANGNMSIMPHLPLMQWDFHDQLQATARQAVGIGTPETTWYVYDSAGQRVRKVIERQAPTGQMPTRMKERVYLGTFEVYREYASDGSTVALERETLHIMDDKQRVALIETRTFGNDGGSAQLIRYQLGNHLGSSCLELDDQAQIISYEEYFPFGSTSYQAVRAQTETSKRYQYTGTERDPETDLSYHGSRYYAPWLGKWVSRDPIGLGDGVNLYSYTLNQPIKLVDRSGRDSEDLLPPLGAANLLSNFVVDENKSRTQGNFTSFSDIGSYHIMNDTTLVSHSTARGATSKADNAFWLGGGILDGLTLANKGAQQIAFAEQDVTVKGLSKDIPYLATVTTKNVLITVNLDSKGIASIDKTVESIETTVILEEIHPPHGGKSYYSGIADIAAEKKISVSTAVDKSALTKEQQEYVDKQISKNTELGAVNRAISVTQSINEGFNKAAEDAINQSIDRGKQNQGKLGRDIPK